MSVTPGRIVHFYSKGVADRDRSRPGYGFNGQGPGPYVALVTQVFPASEYANLLVFPPFGEPFHEGSVSHRLDAGKYAPADHEPSRFWDWPVAPKTETLTVKIDAAGLAAGLEEGAAKLRAARGKWLCGQCGSEADHGHDCACGASHG